MDSNERSIEAQLAAFREAVESFDGSEQPPASAGTLDRAARSAGSLLLNISVLFITLGLVAAFGAAARLGWEWAG